VWIVEEADVDAAHDLLVRFGAGVEADRTRQAARAIRERRQQEARPVRSAIVGRDGSTPSSLTAAVVLLIGGCLVAAYASGLGETWVPALGILPVGPDGNFLPLDWAQPSRLVTPIFVHFGLIHLLFNMMWLNRLGTQVEGQHGTLALCGLVVLSAVPGNLLQLLWSGPFFGGMSGVNYGLFGFVWMQSRYAVHKSYSLRSSEVWLLMVWLVVCATGWVGPVADAAHAVGLIVGLCAGVPTYIRFRRTSQTRPAFESGSWQDVSVKGWRRFDRLYLQPYMPAWFVGIAFVVLVYARFG